MLKLELTKPGEVAPKLKLNLSKPSRFSVELWWDSEQDLDGHALLCRNDGAGAKVIGMEGLLSTYNTGLPLADGSAASRQSGDSRPFKTPCGSLTHSGDARTGVDKDIDEVITIDGAAIPQGVNEIPIFVTIHPSGNSTFAQVKRAGCSIKNDQGVSLGEFELSNQFGQFDVVQMGTLVLGDSGWEYIAAGSGLNGDLNTILEHFS